LEFPELVARLSKELTDLGAKVYRMNGCAIIICNEPPHGWHLSISRTDRDPSWQEIVTVRYRLLGEVKEMAMYLPALSEYVNIHPYVFHLYESKS
jgi:hypothetical protein